MKAIVDALGKGNAESDQEDFASVFLETPDYRAVADMSRTLVLGGRGSGKSAIFRTLADRRQDSTSINGKLQYTIAVSADRTSWPVLEQAVSESKNNPLLHSRQWEMTLLLLCFNLLVERVDGATRKPLIRNLKKEVRKVTELQEIEISSEGFLSDMFEAAAGILGQIPFTFKVSSPMIPVTVSATPEEQPKPTPRQRERIQGNLIDSMYGIVRHLVGDGTSVQILIDQLDDQWQASDEQIASLRALIASVMRMQDILLRQGLADSVNFVIFLREDLYETLKRRGLDDATKYRRDELHLRWDEEALRMMIDRRIQVADLDGYASFDDLFTAEKLNRRPLQHYFFSRVVPRPRDVIQLLVFAIDNALYRNNPHISKQDLLDAEANYSGWRRDVLLEETRYGVAANAEALVSSFISKPDTYSPAELKRHLKEAQDEHSVKATKPKMTELLVEWGFLGAMNSRGVTHYVWDLPASRAPRASEGDEEERWVVHPSLWSALDIRVGAND